MLTGEDQKEGSEGMGKTEQEGRVGMRQSYKVDKKKEKAWARLLPTPPHWAQPYP